MACATTGELTASCKGEGYSVIYVIAIVAFLAAGAVGFVRLWNEVLELRAEVRRMRRAQDTLIEMVSSKLLEDDALSREFLKLKLERDDGE